MFWKLTLASLVAYPVTFTVVRILGRKQIATMTFWDLVSAITLGTLAANIVTSPDVPLITSVWIVALWGAMTMATGRAALRNRKAREALEGVPKVVIANGKVLEGVLRTEQFSMDLLLSELRSQGVFHVADVEFAVLEPTGKLSVLQKTQALPVTPHDLHLPTPYKGLETALVMEGSALEANLDRVGLSKPWLVKELAKQGITDMADVFYAGLDTDGTLYVDRYGDSPVPPWQQH